MSGFYRSSLPNVIFVSALLRVGQSGRVLFLGSSPSFPHSHRVVISLCCWTCAPCCLTCLWCCRTCTWRCLSCARRCMILGCVVSSFFPASCGVMVPARVYLLGAGDKPSYPFLHAVTVGPMMDSGDTAPGYFRARATKNSVF